MPPDGWRFDLVDPAPEPPAMWDPYTDMPPQYYDWTCSACSLDWLKRSVGVVMPSDIYASRYETTMEIGYTENISPSVGLHDGSGAQLQRVLADYGLPSEHGWLDFDTVYALAQDTTGCLSGGAWYHWVALRGVQGNNLWIANSAPGYCGIWDTLSRADFNRLGPFSVVYLV